MCTVRLCASAHISFGIALPTVLCYALGMSTSGRNTSIMTTASPTDSETTIKYGNVSFRFGEDVHTGTKDSPAFVRACLPDGRELVYPIWNQGALGHRYLTKHGCSLCALASLRSAWINPQTTPVTLMQQRRKLVAPSWRSGFLPINTAGIVHILQGDMKVDCLDDGTDAEICRFLRTKAGQGLPVIAVGRDISSIDGSPLCYGTGGTHWFLILGMKDASTLIVADSKSSDNERIKYVAMDDMLRGLLRSGIARGLAKNAHYYSRRIAGGLASPRL